MHIYFEAVFLRTFDGPQLKQLNVTSENKLVSFQFSFDEKPKGLTHRKKNTH